MQDIESYLKELEFNMDSFYQESFTPATRRHSEEPQTEVADNENSAVKVFVPTFGKSGSRSGYATWLIH